MKRCLNSEPTLIARELSFTPEKAVFTLMTYSSSAATVTQLILLQWQDNYVTERVQQIQGTPQLLGGLWVGVSSRTQAQAST